MVDEVELVEEDEDVEELVEVPLVDPVKLPLLFPTPRLSLPSLKRINHARPLR